jgi:hypothetical protein
LTTTIFSPTSRIVLKLSASISSVSEKLGIFPSLPRSPMVSSSSEERDHGEASRARTLVPPGETDSLCLH